MSGPLFSGLETSGMHALKCSLRLQPDAKFQPLVKKLPPSQVTIKFDGTPSKKAYFQGCTILQLDPCGGNKDIMPPILTIGGPCFFTNKDKKDFEIMMRTHAQSRQMALPPNGDMDWPDARAFCMCPCCGTSASPSDKMNHDENGDYMMLFYPLMQMGSGGIGLRMICRLVCLDCFESLVKDMTVSASRIGMPESTFSVSLLDAVEDQGPVTWLERGLNMGRREGETMRAFDLYRIWEYTGAWQALQENFAENLEKVLSGVGVYNVRQRESQRNSPRDVATRAKEEEHWIMRSTSKTGRKCSAPGCEKVHRSTPDGGGKKIRLRFCSGCMDTLYCSSECQSAHREEHKAYCKAKQRENKEAEDEKKAQEEAEEKVRMDAVAASFAPMSLLTPQGGGSGKKNAKKKGGNKKKRGKK